MDFNNEEHLFNMRGTSDEDLIERVNNWFEFIKIYGLVSVENPPKKYIPRELVKEIEVEYKEYA